MLVASRKLGSVEELMNLKITSKRDVMGLGLERGLEIVLLQLLAFQQSVDERLMTIEGQLQRIEKGKARAVDEDFDEGGRYSNGEICEWDAWST